MDRLAEIKTKYGLVIIEDGAQPLGAKFKGQAAGTFGLAGAISFFPAKVLGCFGDGGGVLTNDPNMFERLYQLHDHGRDRKGVLRGWGRNSRLDNLQAAILADGLKSYDKVILRRREIAALYQARLQNLDELILPVAPDADSDHFDIYQNYELQAKRRDELKIYLAQCGIGTLIQWGGYAVHQYEVLGFTQNLPKTEDFFRHCIMLPMNMFISDDDVHYVCDQIYDFYRG